MAFSRYARDNYNISGQGLTVSQGIAAIRSYIRAGTLIPTKQIVMTQSDRLDSLAGELYGDSRYWWVLAAASNIGWSMQVPPGTLINVIDLRTVEGILG